MKQASVCTVRLVTATVASGSKNGWNKCSNAATALLILGLWQPEQQFEYALAQGGFEGESYMKVMDWSAQKAARGAETKRALDVCGAG